MRLHNLLVKHAQERSNKRNKKMMILHHDVDIFRVYTMARNGSTIILGRSIQFLVGVSNARLETDYRV